MGMELRHMISIVAINLHTFINAETEYVLVVELIGDFADKFYLLELPVLHYKLEKQLKYYKHIIN
jgi:hypothetical protein